MASKTGIMKLEFDPEGRDHEECDALLWQDDKGKNLSLSIDDPFDGFRKRKNVEKLHAFLGEVLEAWPKNRRAKRNEGCDVLAKVFQLRARANAKILWGLFRHLWQTEKPVGVPE